MSGLVWLIPFARGLCPVRPRLMSPMSDLGVGGMTPLSVFAVPAAIAPRPTYDFGSWGIWGVRAK